MVYMDSAFFGFCIRKALGGAYDEVWQYAKLWFMGLHLRIQNEDMIERSLSEMWRLCASVNSNIVQKCTSIIKNNQVIQNPVDPAGPDCYRIDTKPCESL